MGSASSPDPGNIAAVIISATVRLAKEGTPQIGVARGLGFAPRPGIFQKLKGGREWTGRDAPAAETESNLSRLRIEGTGINRLVV